jgi:hypothetical protein
MEEEGTEFEPKFLLHNIKQDIWICILLNIPLIFTYVELVIYMLAY